MEADQLAVVIPTRRRWNILRKTLDALVQQTVSGFEVVVVVDGLDQTVPDDLDVDQVVHQRQGGPAAARNRGVAATDRPMLLFLGDDMIPDRDCVEQHLQAHGIHRDDTTVVLGHVDWHPRVAWRPDNRWLDLSGTQFDYVHLRGQEGADVGFGRFYSCNVSIPRSLFDAVGGFDDDFVFYYEDLDMGWRLAQAGMTLRYHPRARTRHLQAYNLDDVRARFAGIARGERMMAGKHAWFEPWFRTRIQASMSRPRVSSAWRVLAALPIPRRLQHRLVRRATRWYHQQVADVFEDAWDRAVLVAELAAWLGDDFDASRLIHHAQEVQQELARVGDEDAFYRQSTTYPYDLTMFALSGTKDPYHDVIREHVPVDSRVLDYGCGIGADGVRLLDAGYDVEFADFDNPSTDFLRWRLAQRGSNAAVHEVDRDPLPDDFALAFAFDVIEHVDDPWGFLETLEASARLVLVNLLEEDEHDHEHEMHRELPIPEILEHARQRGLVDYSVHHGRSHLVLYRGRNGE